MNQADTLAGTILVLDDEPNIRRTLRMVLEGEGATVLEADTAEKALAILQRSLALDTVTPAIDAVIADVRLAGMSGIELLAACRALGDRGPPCPMILISGHATLSDAVHATRLGAFDFLEKPLARDRVVLSVRNALRQRAHELELRRHQSRVQCEMVGESPAMVALWRQVLRVGPTRARVLIQGESGTGKELVARAIHDTSERRERPFIKVNCAAIPRELIESELFGHTRGAFTGATSNKSGLFELADGGTLLLDEIGDMDLGAQAKVLRVLQSGELTPVGGRQPIKVDVRVLAATHRDLGEYMQRGEFREDLYFRLAVVPILVPPLRERTGDVALLCRHYLEIACNENGLPPRQITPAALAALDAYPWPGNVRELSNTIERTAILTDGDIEPEDLPADIRTMTPAAAAAHPEWLTLAGGPVPPGVSLKAFREALERAYILDRLAEQGGNVSRTADVLGLERTHLHRKLRLFSAGSGK